MKLIIGLGNPGRNYANNRHNVGFKCVDLFAREHGISLTQRRALSKLGTGEIANTRIVVAKPQTFMNLSGEAVSALVRRYKLSAKDILVIYDDLDLPLGKIRIRERGSAGGHNGLKSIISHLGTQEFHRIKVGIAPAEDSENISTLKVDAIEHVLSDFTEAERNVMREVYVKVAAAIEFILTEDIAAAMNKYN
jgi:PTH1 family peptidyl-tRNA hydrolase